MLSGCRDGLQAHEIQKAEQGSVVGRDRNPRGVVAAEANARCAALIFEERGMQRWNVMRRVVENG
jgi:hypothetical protein